MYKSYDNENVAICFQIGTRQGSMTGYNSYMDILLLRSRDKYCHFSHADFQQRTI